jgi:hypothetical protein
MGVRGQALDQAITFCGLVCSDWYRGGGQRDPSTCLLRWFSAGPPWRRCTLQRARPACVAVHRMQRDALHATRCNDCNDKQPSDRRTPGQVGQLPAGRTRPGQATRAKRLALSGSATVAADVRLVSDPHRAQCQNARWDSCASAGRRLTPDRCRLRSLPADGPAGRSRARAIVWPSRRACQCRWRRPAGRACLPGPCGCGCRLGIQVGLELRLVVERLERAERRDDAVV